ncbi:MAG: 2,3-butanediol dehydrogenase [Actinobacteria bacterium]|nr:2,3-butanediol dehydrogenase [Actinomycetota bacterium]
MRAAVWHGRGDIRVEEVEEARPGPGEVKVAVAWCGISGTDVHEYTAGPIMIPTSPHPLTGAAAPLAMGHELSGVVSEVGPGVEGLAVGDRLACDSSLHCGACAACQAGAQHRCEQGGYLGLSRPGAFAEAICVPAYACFKLPAELEISLGALVEPLSVGVHAMRRGGVEPGSRVAVIGGGPIGLGAVQAARAFGARETFLVEPVPQRRALGERFGAIGLDPSACDLGAAGHAPDVVIECAGHPTSGPLAVRMLRPGGRAVVVALHEAAAELSFNEILFGEKELVGSVGRVARTDFPTVIDLLGRGALDAEAMITRRIGLDEIVAQGFEAMRDDRANQVKILVDPSC